MSVDIVRNGRCQPGDTVGRWCVMVCSVADLVEVLSSCALPVCDVDDTDSESADVVSTELVTQYSPLHHFQARHC